MRHRPKKKCKIALFAPKVSNFWTLQQKKYNWGQTPFVLFLELADEFVDIGSRCVPAGDESDYALLGAAGSPDLK